MNSNQEATSRALALAATAYHQSGAREEVRVGRLSDAAQAQADGYDEMYWERSPEYTSLVTRVGRMLPTWRVEKILDAHGFTVSELIDGLGDKIIDGDTLPEYLDAAMLYAWLGY